MHPAVSASPAALAAPCPVDEADPGKRALVPRPGSVVWADPTRVREPKLSVSLGWFAMQLVPSPELGFGRAGVTFGLRWQLTPVLFSFALDPRLSPWRFFIAEPLVRHAGSIELFISPEYLALPDKGADRFGGRVGLRSYFGVVERGDYLSLSVGTSYYRFGDEHGPSYEAGAYVLFGLVGFVASLSPALADARWLTTLNFRYF
jgi:hypothetical protein